MFSRTPSDMIQTAAIYVFLIIIFFVSPKIFWATLAVILLVSFFGSASTTSAQAESVFTTMTWVALVLVIIIIILAIVAVNTASDRIDHWFMRMSKGYNMMAM